MSITRITPALCVLAALAPATALAQPSTGGGSDSSYCKTLKSRAAAYNDIARDPSQPTNVRVFYAARARIVLIHARDAGCSWATFQAAMTASPQAGITVAKRPTSTSRTLSVRKRLGKAEAARKRSGTTTSRPPGPATKAVAAKVGSSPTGNGKLDAYCKAVAGLIEEAENAADDASVYGDPQGAAEWYELADHMTYVATGHGCRFTAGIRAQAVPGPATRG